MDVLLLLPGTDEADKLPSGSRDEEVSGPSHRIGLSGANKTMLHLLKKAKVQLIKIDQQKQLKLSQVKSVNPTLLILFGKLLTEKDKGDGMSWTVHISSADPLTSYIKSYKMLFLTENFSHYSNQCHVTV